MEQAAAVAHSTAQKLSGVVAGLLPASSLLAETARVRLTEADVQSLEALATLDAAARRRMLLSANQLAKTPSSVPVSRRQRLLSLLGLYGIARCLEWIEAGHRGASALAERLWQHSGVDELQTVLEQDFQKRSDALKADAGLRTLERLCYMAGSTTDGTLAAVRTEIERARLEPDMHQVMAMWAFQQTSTADIGLPSYLEDDLKRLATGDSLAERVGLPSNAAPGQLREAAQQAANRWHTFQNAGRATVRQREIARVISQAYVAIWEKAGQAE
jgi:hypothetical protein